MSEMLINHVYRAGSVCVKEIEIGRKVIRTVQTLPKLQSRGDIRLFLDNPQEVPDFDGVVLDFWSLSDLRPSLFVGDGQRRLEDNMIAITPAKVKMGEKVLIIDPNTEEFHNPYPLGKDKNTGIKKTRLSNILGQKGCPQSIAQIMNETKKDGAWRTIEARNLLLSYVDWYIQVCVKNGADIILPPCPLINGKSDAMLKIAKDINQLTKEIITQRTQCYPSNYIPISSDAFLDEKAPQRIVDLIDNIVGSHILVALKIYRSGVALDNVLARHRIKEFFMAIDAMKREYDDNLAVMVLDTKAEGIPYFGNGVDITCDPLGGVKDSIQFSKGKKREDTGDEDESQPEMYKGYGKYYHPVLREFLSIDDVKSVINPFNGPIHNCEFCAVLNDVVTKEKDEPGFPKKGSVEQWEAAP